MAIPAEQQEHRIAFGKAVTAWMRMNSFSQQTIHDWATAAETTGPWNSQVSLAQRGKLDAKPQLFVAFGQLKCPYAMHVLLLARVTLSRLSLFLLQFFKS